jgi:hypothetical protein
VNKLAQKINIIFLIYAALILAAFPAHISAADSYVEAARELAGKIVTNMGLSEDVGFAFQSLASLEGKEAAAARRAIEIELKAKGMRLAGDSQSIAKIRVTLSESFQQYVWTAEIRKDQSYSVVIATQPRTPEAPPKDAALRMSIQAKLLYEQNDPILDARLMGDALLILDPQRLSLYQHKNDQWELASATPLKNLKPLRDMRGRLFNAGDSIQVYLPGQLCSGTSKPSLILNCSQESHWPIGIGGMTPISDKNYFILEGLPAFFSAAGVEEDGTELLAIAGIDGRTFLFDKAAGQVGTLEGWGSDIASVNAGCATRRQILAALATDPMEYGVIQAFEVQHRKAIATSSTVEFPGPITALWPVQDQNAAIAVSHDLKTGRYAAFHLSISCSR